jgi:hypothetical protein
MPCVSSTKIKPDSRGLVPGIHVFAASKKDVDGRDKPGHDEKAAVFHAVRKGLTMPAAFKSDS